MPRGIVRVELASRSSHEERILADLVPYKLNRALAGKSGNAAHTAVSDLVETTFGKDVDTLWDEYQDTAF